MKTVHIYVREQIVVDVEGAEVLSKTISDVQAAIRELGGDGGSVHVTDDAPVPVAPVSSRVRAVERSEPVVEPVAKPEPLSTKHITHPAAKAKAKE